MTTIPKSQIANHKGVITSLALACFTQYAAMAAPATIRLGTAPDFNLGGLTLSAGNYTSMGPLLLSGTLTLDGGGDPNATFLIQTDSTFDTSAGSTVDLINGAEASHVFWVIDGSTTLGANSDLEGIIMDPTSVTIDAGATVDGRIKTPDMILENSNSQNAPIDPPNVPEDPSTLPMALISFGGIFLIYKKGIIRA